ncbi:aromatic-ring-hydroxylating dioxygenase subunit beta [Micromonospora radicis]|nr:aromatic-ring-hydroxylating dioxygenase subunit beta [Micromonospora radicis]
MAVETVPAELAVLLRREAMLLDQRDYHGWLDLFTEDCRYWMPVDPDAADEPDTLCHVFDDHARLTDRVWRTANGAHTEDPPARTARVLGEPVHLARDADEVSCFTPFLLLYSRRGRQETFGGSYQHRAVTTPDGWRIREKRIRLIDGQSALPALTIIF